MRILGVIHQDNAGPGMFEALIASAGHEFEVVNFAAGERPERAIDGYEAIIVFGGSPQVDEEGVHTWLAPEKQFVRETIDSKVPLLGICLGAQLIADVAGAWVGPSQYLRRGWHEVAVAPEAEDDPIFGAFGRTITTVVWHGYEFRLPEGAVPLASTSTSLQAFRLGDSPAWAVQFHPEVEHESLLEWVALADQSQPDGISAAEREEILADLERHRVEQRQVAEQVLTGFLAGASACSGAGEPGDDSR